MTGGLLGGDAGREGLAALAFPAPLLVTLFLLAAAAGLAFAGYDAFAGHAAADGRPQARLPGDEAGGRRPDL